MTARRTRGRWTTGPAVHTRRFDEELIILDLGQGEYMALDPVGATLWEGLLAGQDVDEVAAAIVAEYDVTLEQAKADLEALADDLLARGLLVRVDGP